MGRIPQHFIDELIARADIVEIIGARVQLKKAGREYKACCPFHDEKTPSFWVSPDKQFYHCFGCGKHGTVLGFLMDHDHMAFPEAVEELATRLGLEVPHEGGSDPGARRAEDSLYDLTKEVARFYAECLARDARARDYVARRGLTAETLERFQHRLRAELLERGAAALRRAESGRKGLSDAGLIVERERGQVQRRRAPLRPLPRPHHVPDPRCARPHHRLRRPHHRCRGAEIPQFPGDACCSTRDASCTRSTKRAARVPTLRAC